MSTYPVRKLNVSRVGPATHMAATENFHALTNEDNSFRKQSSKNNVKYHQNSNVIYEDLKPVITLLRIMGVVPLQGTKTGEVMFKVASPAMVYSVCVYGVMLAALWLAHGYEVRIRQYDDSILALYHLVLLLLVVVIPVTSWRDTPKIVRYINNWSCFKNEFLKVTGEQLTLSLRKKALFLSLCVPCASTLLELSYQLLDSSINLSQLVTDIYLLIFRVLLVVFWHLICLALGTAADKMLDRFRTTLKSVWTPAMHSAEYRVLWLSLTKLTRRTGSAMCYTYGFFILYMFMKLTLNIYWTINALLFAPSKLFVFVYVSVTIVNDVMLVYVVCDDAQVVVQKVGDNFKDVLMEYRTSIKLHSVQEEVDVFLQVIETSPPVLNLGDFVVVNRRLLISLGSVMVTYLVVLLQFKMSNLSSGRPNNTDHSYRKGRG